MIDTRILLKLLPYTIAFVSGVLFYVLSNIVSQDFYDLFINISAAFIAIPLLYLFYDLARSYSHKKLNQELFDYAKLQIDREVLSIVNQLQKIVLGLENREFSFKGINEFLALDIGEIKNVLKKNEYLGFQVLQNWVMSEKEFHDILKNPFILLKLEDDQIISIIGMLKSLRRLERVQKSGSLYRATKRKAVNFKIQSGVEISAENKALPDRYLLLERLKENEYVVKDFGDISKYNLEKCLNYFVVNDETLETYCNIIHDLISCINNWVDITGDEFLLDQKKFRPSVLTFRSVSNGES